MQYEDDPNRPESDNPFEAPSAGGPGGVSPGASFTGGQDWSPVDAIVLGGYGVTRDPMIILIAFVAGLCMQAVGMLGGFIQAGMMATNDPELALVGAVIRLFFTLLNVFVAAWITLGYVKVLLSVARGQRADISELFSGGPYGSMLGAMILTFLATLAGTILLIVPGIIVAIGLQFYAYRIVDRGEGAVDSMGSSWQITTGHKWMLFVYALLCFAVMLLGLLACCVGAIVAAPIIAIGNAYIYLCITGEAVGGSDDEVASNQPERY